MEREYDVILGDRPLGKAWVRQVGLYDQISLRCNLPGDGMYRVTVRSELGDTDLGILIPMSDGFGLETQVPMKRLGEGKLSFVIKPRHRTPDGQFVPLSPEEPFTYLSRLKDAFLVRRNGDVGLSFR